jgi:hypothetical protein
VIEVNLKNAEPKYVIEAKLFEGRHDFIVHINKTTDYYGNTAQEPVKGAEVTLFNENGEPFLLNPRGDGLYKTDQFRARAGAAYRLQIKNVEDKTFLSTAFLPQPAEIDSLEYEYKAGSFGSEDGYAIAFTVFDRPNFDNYYRAVLTVNGVPRNKPEDLILFSDRLSNGRTIKYEVFRERFKKGDSIEVDVQCMDKNVYEYFRMLRSAIGEGRESAAPSNPNTNISGGALGVFGAFTSTKTSVLLK